VVDEEKLGVDFRGEGVHIISVYLVILLLNDMTVNKVNTSCVVAFLLLFYA